MSDVLWRRLRYFLTPQFDIYEHLGPKLTGQQVLEVGFGTGFGTMLLAEHASSVNAIEKDQHAVDFAERCLALGNVAWLTGDVTLLSRHDTYDAVVMVEVLEHIKVWRQALANVKRQLVKGGKLYITARNANADLRRNDLHEREWTAAEFVAALGEFFPKVTLFDYTLENELDTTTRVTPLVAVCEKG